MKKLLCLLLALVMIMSLCACEKKDDDDDDDYDRDDEEIVEEEDDKKEDSDEGENEENFGEDAEGNEGLPMLPVREPTAEELEVLSNYRIVIAELNDYAQYGTILYDPYEFDLEGDHLFGSDALGAYYAMLQNMDAVDEWAGTEYANDETVNWDRQAVLNSFTVVEDVVLRYTKTETDNLGNVKDPYTLSNWEYYADGNVKSISNEVETVRVHMGTDYTNYVNYTKGEREYDEAGRLSTITSYNGEQVVEVCTYTYDAEGKLIKQLVQKNTTQWEINDFTYDAEGRLVRFTLPFGSSGQIHEMVFTYNDDGTLASEEKNIYVTNDNGEKFIKIRYRMEYTYDSGKLVSGVYKEQEYLETFNLFVGTVSTRLWQEQVDQYSYVLDDQGRIVQEIATVGGLTYYDENGNVDSSMTPSVNTTVYDTVYGNYYIYNGTNE